MPIVIKEYQHEQTLETLFLSVPLKGVKKEKVNIFSTDDFIKISFPPYIFELLLFKPIEDERSSAKIDSGVVIFTLVKQEPEMWDEISSPHMDDKDFMKRKREEALMKIQERVEKEATQRSEKKRADEKLALHKAMDLDAEERQRIELIKETERKHATEELEAWKDEQRKAARAEKERMEAEATRRRDELEAERRKQRLLEKKKKKGNIFGASEGNDGVRQTGKIEVTFTPRVFPTAQRESTKHLEDEWLKKQAEARRTIEIEDADLTEEERNPEFMKSKGDGFFRNGDFQAAINAYTHAIRLSKGKLPSLYSNRAACHLKIRNLIKCVEDSSKALELLNPPVEQNAASRCKAHVRRGTAFCELELYVEGLQDYNSALKIDPNNPQLISDTNRIREIVQSSSC